MYTKKDKIDWDSIIKNSAKFAPKIKMDFQEYARPRSVDSAQAFKPKNCIAKTKQDCFYFVCIHSGNQGARCELEDALPVDGIALKELLKGGKI